MEQLLEEMIISKEDMKEYFNDEKIISKEKYNEYLLGKNKKLK